MKALLLVSVLWSICFVACLALARIAGTSESDSASTNGIADFREVFFLIFTTFHGNTWGHIAPVTTRQRFASSVAALLGYLFTPTACAMCLKAAGAQKQLKRSVRSFSLAYFACASIAVLIHAVVYGLENGSEATALEERTGGFPGPSLYYAWMTFHNRSYGDLHPDGAANAPSFSFALISSVLSLMPAMIGSLTALAFSSTAQPAAKACGRGEEEVRSSVGVSDESWSSGVDHEKVMGMLGIPGLDEAPSGMAAIVLKDRIAGDTAAGMVAVLYESLPGGAQRQERMQVPSQADGWLVYVPEEDAAELQEVWQRQMKKARKNIEEQFKAGGKKRRAPRLCFQIPLSSCSSSAKSSASSSEQPYSQSSCASGTASDSDPVIGSASSTCDDGQSFSASI